MSAANAVDTSVWFDLLVCSSGIGVGLILAPMVVAIFNSFIVFFGLDYADSGRSSLSSAFHLCGVSFEVHRSAEPSAFEIFLFYLILSYGIATELVI